MKRKIRSDEDVIVEENDEDELDGKEKKRQHLAGNWRKKKSHSIYNEKERETHRERLFRHNGFITNILEGQFMGEDGREEDQDNYLLKRYSATSDGLHFSSTPEKCGP